MNKKDVELLVVEDDDAIREGLTELLHLKDLKLKKQEMVRKLLMYSYIQNQTW